MKTLWWWLWWTKGTRSPANRWESAHLTSLYRTVQKAFQYVEPFKLGSHMWGVLTIQYLPTNKDFRAKTLVILAKIFLWKPGTNHMRLTNMTYPVVCMPVCADDCSWWVREEVLVERGEQCCSWMMVRGNSQHTGLDIELLARSQPDLMVCWLPVSL